MDILSFIVPLSSNTEFLVLTKNPGTEFCAGVVQLQNLKIAKIFKRDENLFDYF